MTELDFTNLILWEIQGKRRKWFCSFRISNDFDMIRKDILTCLGRAFPKMPRKHVLAYWATLVDLEQDSPGALECSVQNLLKGRAFCSTSVPVGPWWPQLGCDQKVITHNDFVDILKWCLRIKCQQWRWVQTGHGIVSKGWMRVGLRLCSWYTLWLWITASSFYLHFSIQWELCLGAFLFFCYVSEFWSFMCGYHMHTHIHTYIR